MLFDKKEMRVIDDYKKAQKHLLNGEEVFMIQVDGSLVQITETTDWQDLLFHTLKCGSFAVRRKKFNGFGTFKKDIKFGNWSFAVSHEKKGGDA